MPLYEYACDDCGHAFEALVRGSESPACPECGTHHLTKQFSTFASTSGGSAEDFCCGGGAPGPSGHQCSGPGCCLS